MAAITAVSCNNSGVYTVRVSGEGAGFYPDSSRVLVFAQGADIRFDEPVASAYLDKGRFDLSFRDSSVKVYELVFEEDLADNSFDFFNFFSDRTPVQFSFSHKYDRLRAKVKGSRDNEEIYLFRQKYDDTYDLTDSLYYELTQKLTARYGEQGYPEEGSAEFAEMVSAFDSISALRDKITEESGFLEWKEDRIRNHKSLAGLLQVFAKIQHSVSGINAGILESIEPSLLELYAEYREIYPDNLLVSEIDKIISSVERLRSGSPYADFSAPSLDGKRYRLSELIEGKIAVLDCWASWCAPCRKHSRDLIPVYEAYKDRGFTVVGVAREYRSLDDMKQAVETEGYPWIQLYDLDAAEGIWDLYGLSTAGGGIFLIGKDGRIVDKIDDVSVIKEYLEEYLGKQTAPTSSANSLNR